VPAGARACPHCGSDERTGWAEDADKWAAGIPTGYAEDDEFDYDEFIRRELPDQAGGRARLKRWLAIILALAVAAFLIAALAL